VDLFGNLSDHAALEQLGVPVIVDAAQSFESQDHHGKFSAEYGIAACVSFSPSKTISSWGSGGAVLTDSDAIADHVRRSRLHGKLRNDDMAIAAGLNSMMSSMECASVLTGLKHADQAYQRRHDIAQYLIDQSQWPTAIDSTRVRNHTYSKLVFQSDDRASVIKKFKDQAIDCVVHYNNLVSDEPLYLDAGQYYSRHLRDISFTVPNQHTLTDAEVERIAQGLK
jgi:dTDP-4-amino-4,6-dideoxygalactose transaminase